MRDVVQVQCTDATPCGYKDRPGESHSRLQSAVLTLSKGPVAPSDAVGKSDVSLIMRSCMADGTLLQPSVPATRIDATFVSEALGDGANGEMWSAETKVGSQTHTVLFAATEPHFSTTPPPSS